MPLSATLPTAPTTPILRSEGAIGPDAVGDGVETPLAVGAEGASDAGGDPSGVRESPPQAATRRDMVRRATRRADLNRSTRFGRSVQRPQASRIVSAGDVGGKR
jgi:hypothetical protein